MAFWKSASSLASVTGCMVADCSPAIISAASCTVCGGTCRLYRSVIVTEGVAAQQTQARLPAVLASLEPYRNAYLFRKQVTLLNRTLHF